MKKKKVNKIDSKELVIYQTKNGVLELRGDFTNDTLWATQAQMAKAFGVDVRTVNEHLRNVYKTKELNEIATIRNFRIVQKEGNREVVNYRSTKSGGRRPPLLVIFNVMLE